MPPNCLQTAKIYVSFGALLFGACCILIHRWSAINKPEVHPHTSGALRRIMSAPSQNSSFNQSNETDHKECGQPRVLWYHCWWFLHACVTCNVSDANGLLCCDFYQLFNHLQFYVCICAVSTADSAATGSLPLFVEMISQGYCSTVQWLMACKDAGIQRTYKHKTIYRNRWLGVLGHRTTLRSWEQNKLICTNYINSSNGTNLSLKNTEL